MLLYSGYREVNCNKIYNMCYIVFSVVMYLVPGPALVFAHCAIAFVGALSRLGTLGSNVAEQK